MVNRTEAAVLLSIHQNSLPSSPITHGAQAFWNRENGAENLALQIQNSLNTAINSDRPKQPRLIPESIYLMNHVQAPAVLVECGFLSNAQEAKKFEDVGYKQKVAFVLFCSIINFLDEGGSLS